MIEVLETSNGIFCLQHAQSAYTSSAEHVTITHINAKMLYTSTLPSTYLVYHTRWHSIPVAHTPV